MKDSLFEEEKNISSSMHCLHVQILGFFLDLLVQQSENTYLLASSTFITPIVGSDNQSYCI